MVSVTLGPLLGLAGLVMVAIGGVIGYFGVRRRSRRKAALDRIEPVEATVTTSTVTETRRGGGGDTGGSSRAYQPVVRFRYQYNGHTYESDRQGWGMSWRKWSNRRRAERKADEYPEGETVTAHVDPQNPGAAFLDRKQSSQRFWDIALIGLGVLFVTSGLPLLLVAGLILLAR